MGGREKEIAMTFGRGDVVWLRVDYVEGGLGKPHPAIVISNNPFNDTHDWGIIVRGSHEVPDHPDQYQTVIKKSSENGLDEDTVFLPIIQSAKWTRITKKVGALSPSELRRVIGRLGKIVEL